MDCREVRMPRLERAVPSAMESRNEALCVGLGKPETATILLERISATKRLAGDRTLLIGGPPCQAYSLAGRSRNAGIRNYRPKDDDRHFLYREYCRVLNELSPAVFVMENVKGMLSSSVEGLAIFEQVVSDLERAGPDYRLVSLSTIRQTDLNPEPKDFVIRAEDHGVPQARHRVIIVGVRSDIATEFTPRLQRRNALMLVRDVLTGLPRLRSGLSRLDDEHKWYDAVVDAMETVGKIIRDYPGENFGDFLRRTESGRGTSSDDLADGTDEPCKKTASEEATAGAFCVSRRSEPDRCLWARNPRAHADGFGALSLCCLFCEG